MVFGLSHVRSLNDKFPYLDITIALFNVSKVVWSVIPLDLEYLDEILKKRLNLKNAFCYKRNGPRLSAPAQHGLQSTTQLDIIPVSTQTDLIPA